jgi:hypothetical protein
MAMAGRGIYGIALQASRFAQRQVLASGLEPRGNEEVSLFILGNIWGSLLRGHSLISCVACLRPPSAWLVLSCPVWYVQLCR